MSNEPQKILFSSIFALFFSFTAFSSDSLIINTNADSYVRGGELILLKLDY